MSEPTELLPCPFCGSNAFISYDGDAGIEEWSANCKESGCGAMIDGCGTGELARRLWNTRVSQPVEVVGERTKPLEQIRAELGIKRPTPTTDTRERAREIEYLVSVIEEDLRRLQTPDQTATKVAVVSQDALVHLARLRRLIDRITAALSEK